MCCIPASGLLSWNAVAECSHSWGDFTVEINATCSEEGKLTRDCLICRATDTAKVEMLSHTVAVDKEIPPTCTSEGLSEGSHCSVCGSMIKEQTELPTTEHIPDVIAAVEATCTSEGLTAGVKCADCGLVLKAQEKIPTVSHVPVIDPAVEPNCQRFGLTEGSHCDVCSQVLDAQQVVPRLEHSYTQNVVTPTCQHEGYTVHTCDCGYSYISNEVRPTFEHVFEQIEDGVGFTCAKCELTVCEYGNVGSDSRVRYYITGTTTEANPKRTLIIFGSGKMPDFAPDFQPPWISRSREITAVILEEGITTVGYCAFYVPEGEYWYSNVRSFVIRHKGLTIRDAISVSGIKCSITYYHH
jgi:hypothetical protein